MNLQNQRSGQKPSFSVRDSGQSPPATSPLEEKYFQHHQVASSASGAPPNGLVHGETATWKETGVPYLPLAGSTSNFQPGAPTALSSAKIEFKTDLLVQACSDI